MFLLNNAAVKSFRFGIINKKNRVEINVSLNDVCFQKSSYIYIYNNV